jgi:hypothetical protein
MQAAEMSAAPRMNRVRSALSQLDVGALNKLEPSMSGRNVTLMSGRNMTLTGPPLCVLLDVVKLWQKSMFHEGDAHRAQANQAIDVFLKGANINEIFSASELRPSLKAGTKPLLFKIKSTPLSWLFYLRHGDSCNPRHVKACMRHLLERGADPNAPFCCRLEYAPRVVSFISDVIWDLSYERDSATNANNGRSLLSMVLELKLNMSFFEMFLEFGARFGPNDPQPLAHCMSVYSDDVARVLHLFHEYMRSGQITAQDATSVSTGDGQTAMHTFAKSFPSDADDALRSMLRLGFTRNTLNRAGETVLQCANAASTTFGHRPFLRGLKAMFQQQDRERTMAVYQALHPRLGLDTAQHVWDFNKSEYSMNQAAALKRRFHDEQRLLNALL